MRRRSTALIALLCALGLSAPAAELQEVGRVTWDGAVVNGVSGLEVDARGLRFDAVSDAGWHFAGRLVRRGGQLEGVELDAVTPILGIDGLPVAARAIRDWSDAEGLAIAPDGRSWIAFERWSRVQGFEPGDPEGRFIRDHPAFAEQRDNRQLEALAVSPGGVVHALPERPTAKGFPLFVLRESGWRIEGHLPERTGFSIVGADFDSGGTLWILERKLQLGLWWRNRISRVDPARLETLETLWTGGRDAFYNLEGLAVWDGPDGLRLLAVTDNNARRGVATEIVEFRLVE